MSAQAVLSKVLGHKDNTAQEFIGSLPGDNPQNRLTQQIGDILTASIERIFIDLLQI